MQCKPCLTHLLFFAKKSLFPLVLPCILIACQGDDDGFTAEDGTTLNPKQECILEEVTNDSTTGFLILEPVSVEYGKAFGTKINEPFVAGLNLFYKSDRFPNAPDTTVGVSLHNALPANISVRGEEVLLFGRIPFPNDDVCFSLDNSQNEPNSISLSYFLTDYDVPILSYGVDPSYDNHFYLDTFNAETGFFRGFFSARMIADTGYLPEMPQVVEFINVEITAP